MFCESLTAKLLKKDLQSKAALGSGSGSLHNTAPLEIRGSAFDTAVLCRLRQWLFTRRSCTQNDFVYIHDGRVHNIILSIYTMVVYIMSVVYIHDCLVLINLGQQVRCFSGFFYIFFTNLFSY